MTGMFKRGVLLSVMMAVLVLGLFVLPGCNKTAPAPEPNVVLIVLDTMRSQSWPLYGYEKDTTPFLSQLASESVVFDRAYSASSWTAPSTASIHTSLLPFQHGITTGYFASKGFDLKLNKIPTKVKTIAETLAENGYATYGIADNVNISRVMDFHRGFKWFLHFKYENEQKMEDKLEEWYKHLQKDKKYFLYIHYNDTHAPLHGREPWYQKKETYKENFIAMYDSEINYVDAKIKKLYKLYGWDKNTLVIVVADHGEELWDHDRMGHGYSLYPEVTRVPFFIYFPPGHRKATRIKSNVSSMDILPTIRGFLGIEKSQAETGVDLMPLVRGETGADKPRFIFSHLLMHYRGGENNKEMKTAILKSVVWDKWHYIYRYNPQSGTIFQRQLFDYSKDPGAHTNVYDANKQTAALMLSKYYKFEKECKVFSGKSRKVKLSKEKIQELKSLGYVK